jgi:hypothetical protein
MKREGKEIKEEVRCWCGSIGHFSHFSSATRQDGKKTVIYKCSYNHTIFEEINDATKRIVKEKKPKTKKSKASFQSAKADSDK